MGTDKKDKFGLWSIVLLGINSIIGTGIFLLPNRAYALMGPSSLLILLFDAFLAGCLALCFAEVAGFFSRNGGPYLYAKAAFGDFVGYEVGVLKLVVTIIAWAAMAVGFATALGAAFPFFAGDTMKNLIAAVLIGGLTIMNIAGVKISKILNNLMTISKLVPLCVFIAVGLFFVNGSNFTPFVPTHMADGAFANAAITMFFAYTGFEAIAVAAEDFKDPKKDLPRGIILTMIIVTIIYMLVVGISIGILGPDLAVDKAPIQTAFGRAVGPSALTSSCLEHSLAWAASTLPNPLLRLGHARPLLKTACCRLSSIGARAGERRGLQASSLPFSASFLLGAAALRPLLPSVP